MKKISIITAFVALALVFSSCTFTRTTSFSDPDFLGAKYSKICVYANLDDFESRNRMEDYLAEAFSKQGVQVLYGNRMFPPTRQWSDEDIQQRLIEQKVDGYLLVTLTNQDMQERLGPAVATTRTDGAVKNEGKKTKYSEVTTTTVNQNTSRTFFSSFRTELIDVKTNKMAWVATSNSETGEGFSNENFAMFKSVAKDVVGELIKNGHIRPRK